MKKAVLLLYSLLICAWSTSAQPVRMLPHVDSVPMLLTDMTIQIECTSGINDLYNFNFERADSQFRWLKKYYPGHPLAYFLLGLSQWWRMMPDIDQKQYDERFLAYMDSAEVLAEARYDRRDEDVESAFFLSAIHAFKARLHAERGNWTRSTFEGKRALRYMHKFRNKGDLSPEFLIGDGLYNYYSIWIPDHYPMLKPVLLFFDKGDKTLGIQQLEQVVKEGFYTRIEAQVFLMRLYGVDENQPEKAFYVSEYLHKAYPQNPYFHRYYARMLYQTGRWQEARTVSEQILARIDSGRTGYESISGRYAAFFLGSVHNSLMNRDTAKARQYFERCVQFAEQTGSHESGYYQHAKMYLARLAKEAQNPDLAMRHYEDILRHGHRKESPHQEAARYRDEFRDLQKKRKKANGLAQKPR